MIAIYQLFKIIIGIFISVFILTFLIFFSGMYSGVQETRYGGTTTQNFKLTAESVYYTANIDEVFTGFAKRDFELSFNTLSNEPGIVFGNEGKIRLTVPTLLAGGNIREVVISKGTVDYVWWQFHYVQAMPRTHIVFNPIGNDMEPYIESIVDLFPDTQASRFERANITFSLCGGATIEEPQSKLDFLRTLSLSPGSRVSCTADLLPHQRLVILDSGCSTFKSGVSHGVCVQPPNVQGMGKAFLIHEEAYPQGRVYKDWADIVALVVGYNQETVQGLAGELLYDYKNDMTFTELGLASNGMARKSEIIAARLQDMIDSGEIPYAEETDVERCVLLHSEMAELLRDLEAFIQNNLQNVDYENQLLMWNLMDTLYQKVFETGGVGDKWGELVNGGCEREGRD